MEHHNLDIYPDPRDKTPIYINEPWLIDDSMYEKKDYCPLDSIRVYVPLDLSKESILRRLRHIKFKYGAIDWRNESNISTEVALLVNQIEIYDQVHFVRNLPGVNGHSEKGIELVREFVKELDEIDSSGDTFPFEEIEELRKEYRI